MRRLYGNLKMSWLTVILFAVAAGVYTGGIMLVDALKDTSFQDIGISHEWWVIFAVIIVVNCEKNWEAMLKCFVFFMISQPLVYAVEVLFGPLTLNKAIHYYLIWLPMIVLTLPGGLIAYYCKKQNPLGAVILGLGNTIQALFGVYYFARAAASFPRHLLSGVVCFGSMLLMSFCIQKTRRYRLISLLLPVALVALLAVLFKLSGRTFL